MATINVPLSDTLDQWRVKTNDISTNIGDIDVLTTVAPTVVGSINELDAKVNEIGDLTTLDTIEKTTIVDAINELVARIVALETL